MSEFEKILAALINIHSLENESNTPDFILAQYLLACLATFTVATQQREAWYGRDATPSLPGATLAKDQREVEGLRSLYYELLYAVGASKYEGETRHQTALRYIQQQENRSTSGQDAPKRAEGE